MPADIKFQNTNQLISRSIQSAKTGNESTDLAVSAMRDINSCIQSIKTLMDETTGPVPVRFPPPLKYGNV